MRIGFYISGVAHAGLIGWVMFGGVFRPDPPPMEVVDVSMISAAQFDALLNVENLPEAVVSDVVAPEPPEITADAPVLSSQADEAVTQQPPTAASELAPDVAPDVTEVTPPAPTVPQDVVQEPPQLPTPEPDTAVVAPEADATPVAPSAERVAPEPVAPPEPEVTIAETVQEATQPDEEGPAQDEVLEETAQEAASTEIATEPKQEEAATTAPTQSLRPRLRPTVPTPSDTAAAADPEAVPNTPEQDADDAIAAALAEAASASSEAAPVAAAPSGPPLTRGERDGLRVAVQQCWVVDVGSRAADVTVVVGLSLDRDGRVQGDIRLLSADGGDDTAIQTAFQAARRAVLRCQRGGYDLPVEKYDHWRDVEITFNPEKMRSR